MKKFVKWDFKIEEISKDKKMVKFVAEPLVQGFAHTLGNSLRRVMLSSILGASIYAYQIVDEQQEFRNLDGCWENIVQISLNVQKIIVTVDPEVFPDEEEKIVLSLKAKGAQKVLAKDIILPAGVKIVNPEQEIVNLVKDDKVLEIFFFVIQGRGFSDFIANKKLTKNKIGYNAISANFSPVIRVSVDVQEIKIGEQDVTEKLILTVTTNGAASPATVLAKSAKILIAHLEHFLNLSDENIADFLFKEESFRESLEDRIEIKNLDFSERTRNSLELADIKFLDELKEKTKTELLEIKNLGQKSLAEIVEKLHNDFKIDLKD